MPDQKRVHITHDDDHWRVIREGNERASSIHDRKEDAIDAGRDIAQQDKGQLIIHRKDGQIQEERTYRPDPFPPPG